METGFTTATVLLVLFALLATYDGFYLHLIKYRLYEHKESKTEHITHTIRAVLFPMILYFFFLSTDLMSFYAGLILVALDILVLGVDAYTEKDSRRFMGGLPRWEYILHLFVNGFHFAGVSVFLVLKIQMDGPSFFIINEFEGVASYPTFVWLCIQLIPGGIVMGLLHVLLNFRKPKSLWMKLLDRFLVKPGVLVSKKH